jgi:hypothetical protein
LVEDPIEPLIERRFDRDRIDHRRLLSERDVRGAQRLGAAPKGDQAGRPDIGPDIEPPVSLDEIVLEVLRRRTGIVAKTAGRQEPHRVVQPLRPQLERRTNERNRRTNRRRGRREHVVVISQAEFDHRKQRERADADAKLVSSRASDAPRRRGVGKIDLRCLLVQGLPGRRRRVDLGLGSRCRARQQHPAEDGSPNEPSAKRTNRHGTSRPPRQRCKRRLNEALPQTLDTRLGWLCWLSSH